MEKRKMTPLKTLKDIKTDGANGKIRIKAQAIKWVKEEIEAQVFSEISEANKRWMKRLNITEDDLTELEGGKEDE